MIYVTYFYEGRKRYGAISKEMYQELKDNLNVFNLMIHPDEQTMNESFENKKHKTYLKG